ncbi:MAG: hypothetical protein IJ242_06850 [Clostridia bacterium]|nr:hypothetical protein [Clostridia bacterium]
METSRSSRLPASNPDLEGSSFREEMAQHFMLVCQIMTTAIDTVPKARLCH